MASSRAVAEARRGGGESVQEREQAFFGALREAGIPEVPTGFSVVPVAQEIPAAVLAGIDAFIRTFERVTARPGWRRTVSPWAPEIARAERPEVCFFSAWDFHLPVGAPDRWQLIEFNDNGSGFFFAALINRIFYEIFELRSDGSLDPPPDFDLFAERLLERVEGEATAFFGALPSQLFLVLDDPESLARGKFRDELVLLRDRMRRRRLVTEIGTPARTRWDGRRLLFDGREVAFVVNRSTDFYWEGETFSALREAYRERRVYVAPNPFTYATRSDKSLLAPLSRPDWDDALGIPAEERALLSAHVPETWLVTEENAEELARRKHELVFKPARGFASRGILASEQVGRARLRRLAKGGRAYVAQERVPKTALTRPGAETHVLWADLRVWAYRGERFLLSGRGSRRRDALDLTPPGGWLPTYCTRP